MWANVTKAERDHELDVLQYAGANSVRLDLGWASLAPSGPSRVDDDVVRKVDDFMAAAHRRGLKVIVSYINSPCWASSAPESERQNCSGRWWERDVSRYPPADPIQYADSAAWVASRWAADLAGLEVWNEPDEGAHGFWVGSPSQYATLLAAAYRKIKAAAPSVPVLAASLSGADGSYLQELYNAGIAGNFDGLAVHLYSGAQDPSLAVSNVGRRWSVRSGLDWIREVMNANGDRGKDIWVTELGWSTCANRSPSCVDEATQADFLARAISMLSAQNDVKAIEVYRVRDLGDDLLGRYGLVDANFNSKPAYAAVLDAFHAAGASRRDAHTAQSASPRQ
jgi:hypothetical protein